MKNIIIFIAHFQYRNIIEFQNNKPRIFDIDQIS